MTLALVTGGGAGLGRGIAQALRREGYDVVVTVLPGTVFVMGDNRDASADSRVNYVGPDGQVRGLGYVHRDEIVGRAETVLFTLAKCEAEEGLECPRGWVWRGL